MNNNSLRNTFEESMELILLSTEQNYITSSDGCKMGFQLVTTFHVINLKTILPMSIRLHQINVNVI